MAGFNVSCSFADLPGVSARGIGFALMLCSDTAGLIDVTLLADKLTGLNPNALIGWYPDRCVCWWWWKGMGIVILIVIVIVILFSLSHVVWLREFPKSKSYECYNTYQRFGSTSKSWLVIHDKGPRMKPGTQLAADTG